ncbi:MAG: adenosine deaminase [Anaerolineaceae bacterium]|jgi:adenosine deaminase
MIDPSFPLVELHHHLDGSVRTQTIIDLCREHHLSLPAWDVEALRPFTQVTDPQPDILAFFKKFQYQTMVMVDSAACRRIAYEAVEDAAREHIDYLELRFSPWFMAEAHHLDPAMVTEAVCDGIEAGLRDFGLKVNLIGIISRTYGPEAGMKELEALLTQKKRIIALDLAGDEIHYPGELFVEHFRRARDAGWHITVHAGEAAGPKSVWQAIRQLGAERIGHAVHAPEDPRLIDYLREHQIGIESNLTSNVQTSTVAGYASHPLKFFIEQGLKASINTDDPGISAIDLHYEYEIAAPKAGLSPAQIREAQHNALETAFLSAEEKQALLAKKT